MIAIAVIVAACNNGETASFILGIYVNAARSEFSIANDTLFIESASATTYFIHRKTGYGLIKNGKPGKLHYETEEWQAVYDEASKVLIETRRGKVITPLPETGKLVVGKREYIKLTN